MSDYGVSQIAAMSNKDRILSISKKLGLTHVSSNLSCLPVLEEIYAKKKPEDIVALSGGHAHLAHLVVERAHSYIGVIEPTEEQQIEHVIKDYGIHCDRKAGCDVSTGSLGHAVGIILGMALARPDKDHYAIITDGSAQEGSEWEALNLIHKLGVKNIKVYANLNGFTAVQEIDRDNLAMRLRAFLPDIEIRYTDNGLEELQGINGHYDKL